MTACRNKYIIIWGRRWNRCQSDCPCTLPISALPTYLNQITLIISQTLLDQLPISRAVILNPLIVTSKGLSSQQLIVDHVFIYTCSVSHLEDIRVALFIVHQMLQLLLHNLILVLLQLLLLPEENWSIIFLVLKLLPWKKTIELRKETVKRSSC